MTTENRWAGACKLEEIAARMTEINTRPGEGMYLGIEAIVGEAIENLMIAMFPYHYGKWRGRFVETEKRTWELMRAYDALTQAFNLVYQDTEEAAGRVEEVIESLPEILEVLKTDVRAGYEGDPAAKSMDEVIITYPAFKAITIYRIAHKMYEMGVPLIPRIMTEIAHQQTGIDIHPGATIGSYFFIDHGTGVVIGETTTIGEHVKIYQHVTLGSKSFDLSEDGTPVKGVKRHPDIGDRVVIYAGATILGGDTKIGDDCVVGGNVWLTHSLEAGKTITNKSSGQQLWQGRHEIESGNVTLEPETSPLFI
ncbi:MAG: serine acetyltransferase [Mogibacterium sp.]|nr:serine acetyltransferase [Mogibacterium sp.]